MELPSIISVLSPVDQILDGGLAVGVVNNNLKELRHAHVGHRKLAVVIELFHQLLEQLVARGVSHAVRKFSHAQGVTPHGCREDYSGGVEKMEKKKVMRDRISQP